MTHDMKSFQVIFEIIEGNHCPFYKVGEQLILLGKAFSCPGNKETCLILVREMTQLLFKFLAAGHEKLITEKAVFNCRGCTSLIKFIPVSISDTLRYEEQKTRLFWGAGNRSFWRRFSHFPRSPSGARQDFILVRVHYQCPLSGR